MPLHRVTVTLDDDHAEHAREVAARCTEKGLAVEAVLETLGIITGTTEDPAALRAVEGVRAVELEAGYRIPPPDADPQ